MSTLLVLGGTAEARALCPALAALGHQVTASLAGVTQHPAAYGVPTHRGGFGGAQGLAEWMRGHAVDALIDATHPFAETMAHNAARACAITAIPRIRLRRPAWPSRPGWICVPTLAAAAKVLPTASRALLTTGRNGWAPFADRRDTLCFLRSIEPVDALPPHIQSQIARPPFGVADELALIERYGITHLVSKNAGGAAPAKLAAAERAAIPVVMVDQPPAPHGPVASSPGEAVAWVQQTVAMRP